MNNNALIVMDRNRLEKYNNLHTLNLASKYDK